MAADTRLQLVAGDDVGALAALAFDDPAAFSEPTELAGDDLAMAEMAATFARVLGRPVQYVAMPHERRPGSTQAWLPWGAWLDREGYGPTLGALRRLRPGMLTWRPGCAAFAGQPTPPGMEPEKNVADDREQEALALRCVRLARVEVAIQSYALCRRHEARCDDLLGLSAGEGAGKSGCRDPNGADLADLIPDWDVFKRTNTRTVIAVSAGHGVVVGLPGLEPGTSSLSAKWTEPLCEAPFSQVALNRRCRSYVLSSRPVMCCHLATDPRCER